MMNPLHVIVMNAKGGVGKSFVAANLAVALSEHASVAALDVDVDSPHLSVYLGSPGTGVEMDRSGERFVPREIRFSTKHPVRVLSSRMILNMEGRGFVQSGEQHARIVVDMMVRTIWGDAGFFVYDSPAGVREEFTSLIRSFKSPIVPVAVVVAQAGTPESLSRAVDICTAHGIRVVGVIENMCGTMICACGQPVVCASCNGPVVPFRGDFAAMCELLGVPYLGGIPLFSTLAEFIIHGEHTAPIFKMAARLEAIRHGTPP